MTFTEDFECFQYFDFEKKFSEKHKLHLETGVRFSAESIKIENATFSYKTDLSKLNVKTNRINVQNGLITKNGVLPQTFVYKNL